MTGSRRDFSYTDDANVKVSLNLDESNSKGTIKVVGSTATAINLFLAATAPFPPRATAGFKPRGVNTFNKANPVETRFFKIGNPAAYALAIANVTEITANRVGPNVEAVPIVWVVRSARPEKRGSFPNFATDTGLTDGTPDGNDTLS